MYEYVYVVEQFVNDFMIHSFTNSIDLIILTHVKILLIIATKMKC